jgi:predicted transcriptional regulator
MSEQKTGITKAVWLRMLSNGGYWTVQELSAELDTHKRIDRLLEQLAEGGFCNRMDRTDRKRGVKYGVTPGCKVPQDIRLAEVLGAVQAG